MDRSTDKHGPRLDEQLQRETESLTRGAPVEARVEEERELEGPGERDRDPDSRTAPAEQLGADEVEARRELSRHLRLGAFPADRDALVAEARENDAPEPAVDALHGLPEDVTFATVHEVWVALSRPQVAGDPETLRADAAHDPLNEADR